MVIKNNSDLKKKIHQYLEIHRFNLDYSEALIQSIFIQKSLLADELKLPKKESDFIKILEDKVQSTVTNELSTYATKAILKQAVCRHISLLKPTQYTHNPFQNLVQTKSKLTKGWHLVQDSYRPFQMFVYGDVTTNEHGLFLENNPIGFFKEPFQYLALKKNNVTWMSITPFEIETMKNTLSIVNGVVVALGLGLGYFATIAAMKSNVSKVIVIEKDPNVIALYQQHLQPNLPDQHKITIVQSDAFEYLKGNIKADHVFVDIYRTADDGLPLYIAFKKIEKNQKNLMWHYWLEDSILGFFRRYLMIYLEEQLQGFNNDNYKHASTTEDKLLSKIHQINNTISLEDVSQLHSWLSDKNLKEMLSKMDLE